MDPYHPDLRSLRWIPNLPAPSRRNLWWLRRLTAFGPGKQHPEATIEEREGNGARVRLITPSHRKAPAALLWLHGGGLVMGVPGMDDGPMSQRAEHLGIVVVSAYYGLAPERPFPHGLDDAHAAWRWMSKHADELGIDPERIVIGGGSAGGGIAAALVQRIHDEGGTQPAGQLLVYPMLDDRTALRTDVGPTDHPVWTNRANRAGWSAYLGEAFGQESTPAYAVPARRQDVSGLPPAWIGVGTLDLFHDEDLDYAARLEAAGVPVDVDVLEGCVHGFDTLASTAPITRTFEKLKDDFLHRVLDLPG